MTHRHSAAAQITKAVGCCVKSLLLVASVFAATSAQAIVDIKASCRVENDSVTVQTANDIVTLRKNARVDVTFAHYGHGFLPVYLRLPGDVTHIAQSWFIADQPEDAPRDLVRRQETGAIWSHFPEKGSDRKVDILLQCESFRAT